MPLGIPPVDDRTEFVAVEAASVDSCWLTWQIADKVASPSRSETAEQDIASFRGVPSDAEAAVAAVAPEAPPSLRMPPIESPICRVAADASGERAFSA